ncbi:helix-turn-helix domain-containing protein [Galbibacter pacificus]|uniref:AraC family transcriptional regulator n=1 Tax=Galbibacter pacificus TaxID=2996052 RepID=A0ABT6FR08_9FLAO|nr:AraC family transcriptional regulator [Galbibacter pacificus]MDG3581818.1 AraC family transcriptional regulator [Galbibacter pacificus]MDG3585708.1 AraC family transcriptional regulator [Galbibacter pacificus]
MKIKNPIPNKKTSDYVQNILVIENFQVTNPFVLPLFANGTPTLLFQTTKGELNGSSNNLTLFGQTVIPETLTIRDNFTLIAYFFKPFSLFALFGISAKELTDNPIDLNLMESSKAKDLQEQLLNAESTENMLGLIDDYIFSLIKKVKTETQLIRFATQQILKNPNQDTLKNVQDELYVTGRTFQRMFNKNIGIPPNQFRRIGQFSSAFRQLQKKQFENIFDIAFDNGYSDQSHFNRAFKEFTNITPKDYLNFDDPSDT